MNKKFFCFLIIIFVLFIRLNYVLADICQRYPQVCGDDGGTENDETEEDAKKDEEKLDPPSCAKGDPYCDEEWNVFCDRNPGHPDCTGPTETIKPPEEDDEDDDEMGRCPAGDIECWMRYCRENPCVCDSTLPECETDDDSDEGSGGPPPCLATDTLILTKNGPEILILLFIICMLIRQIIILPILYWFTISR
jgi:hypothetical protein